MGKRARQRNRTARAVEARAREALPGDRTYGDVRELLEAAAVAKVGGDKYVWVRDLTDEWVVYEVDGGDTFQADYTIDDNGAVALGDPVKVAARTNYEPVTESARYVGGRVIEAKGTDQSGGRVFRVEILRYGDSLNGRRYNESVMRTAAPMYEGAKAYDHHRSLDELTSSTISGLVGQYRNVTPTSEALEGDLHLLPSATHTAEALDASLASQAAGLPPLVGVSHDVAAEWRPVVDGGRRLQEAVAIRQVLSADVVADPAAGGRVTRMVAGGLNGTNTTQDPEEGKAVTIEELIALLNGATPEQRAEALKGLGISQEDLDKLAAGDKPEGAETVTTDGDADGAGDTTADKPELVGATESAFTRESALGRMVISGALDAAGLDRRFAESITGGLPDRFTEADVTRQIDTIRRVAEGLERAGLAPRVPAFDVHVTEGEADKKVKALDAMFSGDYANGYRSLKQAWADITGFRESFLDAEDVARRILRDCAGGIAGLYDSARAAESVSTTTFDQIFGDSVTRRLVAEYQQPSLQAWRKVVSIGPPINDFRTQRIDRLGGYGVLPGVNQGAPYQPLTTPGDEEATYAITKRGGTEDLTLEAIANDDLRAVQRIPRLLGLAAAQTLYRFVFDIFPANPTCTFDSTALFAVGHANTDNPAVLGQSTLSVGRRKLRQQAAYGDASDILSLTPRFLLVPSALEETAFQLATSAVAIGANAGTATGANVSDIPNIHQGLELIVVDYWSDTNDWYLEADPNMVPTIEVGFYQGRQDPELFVQNDPTIGSVFNADKITYKVRHIYGGTVLDYRGFYRGAN